MTRAADAALVMSCGASRVNAGGRCEGPPRVPHSSGSVGWRDRRSVAAASLQDLFQLGRQYAATRCKVGACPWVGGGVTQARAHALVMGLQLVGGENTCGAVASHVMRKVLVASGYTDLFRCGWRRRCLRARRCTGGKQQAAAKTKQTVQVQVGHPDRKTGGHDRGSGGREHRRNARRAPLIGAAVIDPTPRPPGTDKALSPACDFDGMVACRYADNGNTSCSGSGFGAGLWRMKPRQGQ